MKIPNINCKQYDRYGSCNKKPKLFWIFKPDCCDVRVSGLCDIKEEYERPDAPKVLPPPFPYEVTGAMIDDKTITKITMDIQMPEHIAREVCELIGSCYGEGISPEAGELLLWISEHYPDLKEEFNWVWEIYERNK